MGVVKFITFVVLILCGCSAPKFAAVRTPMMATRFDRSHIEMRRTLRDFYQVEATKAYKAELRLQLSQSRTNYPPYAAPKK